MRTYNANSKLPLEIRYDMENSAVLFNAFSSKIIGVDGGDKFSDYVWDKYIIRNNRDGSIIENYINDLDISDKLKNDMFNLWNKYNSKIPNIDKYLK